MRKIAFSLIGLLAAWPAMAQETTAMKQAHAFMGKWQAAINSQDPDRAASMFTGDAVFVGPTGVITAGPSSAKQYYAATYKQFGNKFAIDDKLGQARLHGSTMWMVGNSTVKTNGQGHITHFAVVAIKTKDGWKAEMLTVGINPSAPAAR